jgi:hypothetical protein
MEPVDVPRDAAIVRAVARHHEAVTGRPPAVVGALLPLSYSAGDASWLWGQAGIPCVYYGPGGGFLEPGPGGRQAYAAASVTAARQASRHAGSWPSSPASSR